MGAGIQQRNDSRGPCPEGAPDHGAGQTDIKTNIDGITNLMRIWRRGRRCCGRNVTSQGRCVLPETCQQTSRRGITRKGQLRGIGRKGSREEWQLVRRPRGAKCSKEGQHGWSVERADTMRGAAVQPRGAVRLVLRGLEPAKGLQAEPRREELFLVLVLEAGLASFLFCFPSHSHPDCAADPTPPPTPTLWPPTLPQPLHRITVQSAHT